MQIIKGSIKQATQMVMQRDLQNMKRVMRRLDVCDSNDIPLIKGKVAGQISATDELLATELLFSGIY